MFPPVLAVGAESKGVFALTNGSRTWLSRNFGALTEPHAFRNFDQAIMDARTQLEINPKVVASDLHPSYMSTAWAIRSALPRVAVQHHHAHIAACMADNDVTDSVIGVCCDGAGCGTDKASWGCEVLRVSPGAFTRLAHLRYFPLPGADAAASQCWRPALSLMLQAFDGELPQETQSVFASVQEQDIQLATRMIRSRMQCPLTSSLGRLFDAVAFILGICQENTYEGQAACMLQAAAEAAEGQAIPVGIGGTTECVELDFAPALRTLWQRKVEGRSASQLAADFHETIAAMLAGQVLAAAERSGTAKVAMSGGCFMNGLLRRQLRQILSAEGIDVLEHRTIPCTDAGLPVGQAMIGAALISAGNSIAM